MKGHQELNEFYADVSNVIVLYKNFASYVLLLCQTPSHLCIYTPLNLYLSVTRHVRGGLARLHLPAG
jgi:hypothetical protein